MASTPKPLRKEIKKRTSSVKKLYTEKEPDSKFLSNQAKRAGKKTALAEVKSVVKKFGK